MSKEINEKELIGKRIVDIDIDGFGISIIMEDDITLEYSASDGGYSTYGIYKGADDE